MPRPILYSFRRCPYAMRARLALAYCCQKIELREIILRDKPASMLEYSPKGTVPILILDKEKVLEESMDIMYWALVQNDPDNWLPENTLTLQIVQQLIGQCDNEFKHQLDRYKYADRHPEYSMKHYRQQGEVFLEQLDTRLSTTPFLAGERLGLADMAIFPFVRQFAHVDKAWFEQSTFQYLQEWLDKQLKSDLFLSIMKKYPAWKEGDSPVYLPESN